MSDILMTTLYGLYFSQQLHTWIIYTFLNFFRTYFMPPFGLILEDRDMMDR